MKKTKQRATTIFTIDSNRRRLAHVALAETDQRVTLYAHDLERVLAAGWSPFWSYTRTGKPGSRRRYVLVNARNPKDGQRTLTVARLVAEAGKRQVVRYVDGDTLNLRRENLLVQKGIAWMAVETLRPKKEDQREDAVTTAPQRATQGTHVSTANFREGI